MPLTNNQSQTNIDTDGDYSPAMCDLFHIELFVDSVRGLIETLKTLKDEQGILVLSVLGCLPLNHLIYVAFSMTPCWPITRLCSTGVCFVKSYVINEGHSRFDFTFPFFIFILRRLDPIKRPTDSPNHLAINDVVLLNLSTRRKQETKSRVLVSRLFSSNMKKNRKNENENEKLKQKKQAHPTTTKQT